MYLCVVGSTLHRRTFIRSVHEQTVQMPALIHGDLIKSDVC